MKLNPEHPMNYHPHQLVLQEPS